MHGINKDYRGVIGTITPKSRREMLLESVFSPVSNRFKCRGYMFYSLTPDRALEIDILLVSSGLWCKKAPKRTDIS